MSLDTDEYNDEFEELKARELIDFLLKNDIKIYRKLIPEIKKLNSEEIENMIKGVPFKSNDNKDGFCYNVKSKKEFGKLLDKFDNFYIILEEWYKKEEYYKYLKELWIKYISIENLKNKNEKEIEEVLKSNLIDFANWPKNIKDELLNLINNTKNTRIFELKDFTDDKFTQINSVLEELINFRDTIKNQGDEGKIYENNTNKIINNIIGTIMLPIGCCSKFGNDAIEIKEIKSCKKYIMNQCHISKEESSRITNVILKEIEKNKNCNFNYNIKDGATGKIYENCNINCTNGKIDNLSIDKKCKTFLKCKAVCGIHCALSFLNLGWSIIELNKTYKDCDKIKVYEKRLNTIITLFNIHKKGIGILPEDFQEAAQRIKKVLEEIRQDQRNLEDLISEIEESIKTQQSRKERSITGVALSGFLGVVGITGSLLTSNTTAFIYGVSSLSNIFSAIAHSSNIYMSIDSLESYRKLLQKAKEQRKIIQDEIDKLIKELYSRIEQDPKFDLGKSISSISTQG